MNLEKLQGLIGKAVNANGIYGKVGGVHVYFNHKGAMSIRLHLVGIEGYFKLSECTILSEG